MNGVSMSCGEFKNCLDHSERRFNLNRRSAHDDNLSTNVLEVINEFYQK